MKSIFYYIVILIVIFFTNSCTDNFEELNKDKQRITTLTGEQLDRLFTSAQYHGTVNYPLGGGYQEFHNLYGDMQAQFFAGTQPRFSNDRNTMNGEWHNKAWKWFTMGVTTLAEVLEATGPKSEFPDENKEAVAKIWKVFVYIPFTDSFGPLPYFEVGSGKDVVPFDSQEAIYNDFFKSLSEATDVLYKNISDQTVFSNGDKMFNGSIDKWIKFGNSIRLRCAMRVSTKFPELGKKEAEAAIAHPGGLMIDNLDNAFMQTTPPSYINQLCWITEWNEFRMSAAMQSVLLGYNDPRLIKFFSRATDTNQFKGIRNGLSILQMSQDYNSVVKNSNISSRFFNKTTNDEPIGFMMASETWFNLAEAALNGWNTNGKTAKECYESGVRASLQQWGVSGSFMSYISSTRKPAALNDEYATPPLSDLPVVFSTVESEQREQIGLQKWLALYPYSGMEAWAEFRRTGFPKLYPRLNNDNPDATLEAGSVKRLTFPPNEAVVNKEGFDIGLQVLGGPDKTSTKLWWQK